MISPSEDQGNAGNSLPGMPERLVNDARRRNQVTRLEFNTVQRVGADPVQDADFVLPVNSVDMQMQEQVAAMERQLKLLEDQTAARIELAREQARTQTRQEWEERLEERIATERARVARVCEEFGKERARYFADVEAEVVKLALAIAKRVLHREANLDPLLLLGAVRVVLGKVADNSTVELRVSVAEVESWREVIAAEGESRLQLMGDERLDAGECVLETSVGRVELGVNAQLEEIEKGFFDLLQKRPV
jgi:flagellar assembly protein FliH